MAEPRTVDHLHRARSAAAYVRALGGLVAICALAATGCDSHTVGPAQDLGSDAPIQLSLNFGLTPPSVAGLVVSSGQLSITHVGVFGDVPADMRTSIGGVEFALPADEGLVPFADAPYGIYSRVGANLDDVEIQGTWRDMPLMIAFEVEYLPVDLRGAPVEYSPTASATLSVTVDMTKWFDPSELNEADTDGGTIHIDGHRNPDIADDMARAIQGSFSLTTNGQNEQDGPHGPDGH